ncbi:MAG: competence/damage-inducible protein A [Epulopiscium sp. Nele67-Bin001]|nr:MAG: competence/damage-inducible protein A [Epulopiscium sp. Nele67-Bin001]
MNKIEIIAVGNEIVYGYTLNTNSTWMSAELEKSGIEVCYHTAIRDRQDDINQALNIACSRANIIILCGGLGPTKDDFTKEEVSNYFGLELCYHQQTVDDIKNFFAKRNKIMGESNLKQAYFPKGSTIIPNHNGTAPGCYFEQNNILVALFPGPPRELHPMFQHFIKQCIYDRLEVKCLTEEIRLYGIGESEAANKIDDLLGIFNQVEIAPYIQDGYVTIRLKGYGKTKEEIKTNINTHKSNIIERLQPFVIGEDSRNISELIFDKIKLKGYKISTAESCTGGMLAARIVDNNGASEIFSEGLITYSNEAKTKLIGVKAETLDQFGAVSIEVAKEMAIGVKNTTNSEIGISTTGIAGPTGATADKPVGLVFIGIAINDTSYAYKLNLVGSRQEIRKLSVDHALHLLYKLL